MSQILNSLVISSSMKIQDELESIMSNNIEDYVLSFMTYPKDHLSALDREPDLIFIDGEMKLQPSDMHKIVIRFPRKTCIVLDDAPEQKRRDFLKEGIDEVMSLAQLRSDLGKHLLEKILTLKDLADAEVRIEQSEERFRGIIEHSHDIITLMDDDATILYTSPAFARQLGYETWEVLGQSFFDFIHEDDRKGLEYHFKKLLSGQVSEVATVEFQFKRQDGEWRIFETVATNLLNNETVRAVVFNSRDITEQKSNEIELDKYRHHLEDLVERRTRELAAALEKEKQALEQQKTFVSMVSHEFRTPLTIIDGNAQIIQRRGETLDKDTLEKRAGTIRSAVERLVRLIETVLSAHMLESGKLYTDMASCDLEKIIRDVCEDMTGISPRHNILLDIRGDIRNIVLDEKMMRQTMINLISNAVKYSPNNPLIEVRTRKEGLGVTIEVRDRGLGIPAEEIPRMFSKYFRASTSGGIPGSGLGLHLVKQFIELHQGQIGLESRMGEGTTVTVKIPADLERAVK